MFSKEELQRIAVATVASRVAGHQAYANAIRSGQPEEDAADFSNEANQEAYDYIMDEEVDPNDFQAVQNLIRDAVLNNTIDLLIHANPEQFKQDAAVFGHGYAVTDPETEERIENQQPYLESTFQVTQEQFETEVDMETSRAEPFST